MLALTEASSSMGGAVIVDVISIVIALLFAWACNRIAVRKGRGPVLWAILGFFFSLIALIIIAILPRKKSAL